MDHLLVVLGGGEYEIIEIDPGSGIAKQMAYTLYYDFSSYLFIFERGGFGLTHEEAILGTSPPALYLIVHGSVQGILWCWQSNWSQLQVKQDLNPCIFFLAQEYLGGYLGHTQEYSWNYS